MDVKFDSFIDYDKRIGKMIISGKEGTGKTLLLTAIAIGKMLHGFQDCQKSYSIVDEYNSMGYNFSKNYEHLCFANYDINCYGTKIPTFRVYAINPYRLGFDDEDFDTDLLPPRALVCETEGKNFLDAYEWDKFPNRYISWLKTLRQADIDMVVDTQYFGDICTIFRRLTNRFVYLYKPCEEIKNDEGHVTGHKLFVIEWEDNRDVELFERTAKKQNCNEYTLIIPFCVYQNYDNKYCRLLHLKGRENQDFRIEHFPKIETKEDVETFADEFGFSVPDGFYKSNKKTKNKDTVEPSLDDMGEDYSNYF